MTGVNQYQPSTELAKIREHGCLFARAGKVRLAEPVWQGHLSLIENLTLSKQSLDEFVRDINSDKLDIWIYTISDPQYSRDLFLLSQTLNQILQFLSDHDP